MIKKISALKDLLWAFAIIVSLIALVIGLLFAAFSRYHGAPVVTAEAPAAAGDAAAVLKEPAATEDAGQAYTDSLTFVCDSAYALLPSAGLTESSSGLWLSSTGTAPASALSTFTVNYNGNAVTPTEAAGQAQPGIIVLALGMDGLEETTPEALQVSYLTLVNSLKSASPASRIMCCSLSSVSSGYIGAVTVQDVMQANEAIKNVCLASGAYYADIGAVVSDGNGYLAAEYASTDGKTVAPAGLSQIFSWLRTHALAA